MSYFSKTKTAVIVGNDTQQQKYDIIAKKRPYPAHRPTQYPTPPQSDPIIINIPKRQAPPNPNTLSYYLEKGRHMHPLCRDSFIERIDIGYYHYERRTEWRTCALAAAYAGAFGPRSVERPEFSYSMAIWQLSQKVGYDLRTTMVHGPTGRCQPVIDEMIQLIDIDGWTRAGVAQWLQTLKL